VIWLWRAVTVRNRLRDRRKQWYDERNCAARLVVDRRNERFPAGEEVYKTETISVTCTTDGTTITRSGRNENDGKAIKHAATKRSSDIKDERKKPLRISIRCMNNIGGSARNRPNAIIIYRLTRSLPNHRVDIRRSGYGFFCFGTYVLFVVRAQIAVIRPLSKKKPRTTRVLSFAPPPRIFVWAHTHTHDGASVRSLRTNTRRPYGKRHEQKNTIVLF